DQLVDSQVERLCRQARVELRELRPQTVAQDHLGTVIAARRAARNSSSTKLLGVGVDDLVAEVPEQRERRLLNQVLLGEALGRHLGDLVGEERAQVDVRDVEVAGYEAGKEQVARAGMSGVS